MRTAKTFAPGDGSGRRHIFDACADVAAQLLCTLLLSSLERRPNSLVELAAAAR